MPLTQDYLNSRIHTYIQEVITKAPESIYISELDIYISMQPNTGLYTLSYDNEDNVKIENINLNNLTFSLKVMLCRRHGENPENFS